MSRSSSVRVLSETQDFSSQDVVSAIDSVLGACKSQQFDAAIEREIGELVAIRSAVEQQWPLSLDEKRRIDIGPFAAKNLADWISPLADLLMKLDYVLQNDGDGLEFFTRFKVARLEAAPEPSLRSA